MIAADTTFHPTRRAKPGRPAHLSAVAMFQIPPQSDDWGDWQENTGNIIRTCRVGHVPGLVQVAIRAAPPSEPRELGRLTMPVLAVLAEFGVIDGDRSATRILTEWASAVPQGVVAVEVRQISPPISRHRIQIATRQSARRGA